MPSRQPIGYIHKGARLLPPEPTMSEVSASENNPTCPATWMTPRETDSMHTFRRFSTALAPEPTSKAPGTPPRRLLISVRAIVSYCALRGRVTLAPLDVGGRERVLDRKSPVLAAGCGLRSGAD